MGKNGKIRPGFAMVDGVPVHFPEGHYELRMYECRRMIYQNVGDIATDALAAQKRAEDMMEAENKASLVGATIVHDGPVVQKTLEQKKKEFIKRLVAKGHQRASETAEQA
ncbi:MAG TPA: hypothetical protein VFE22_08050, partial [Edaphobacter sp.]|nr:hypothetical protein [Edaphobacter sp.]